MEQRDPFETWENGTTFSDDPFISGIFQLDEPRNIFHLHSSRNFRNFLVNGKQPQYHLWCHVFPRPIYMITFRWGRRFQPQSNLLGLLLFGLSPPLCSYFLSFFFGQHYRYYRSLLWFRCRGTKHKVNWKVGLKWILKLKAECMYINVLYLQCAYHVIRVCLLSQSASEKQSSLKKAHIPFFVPYEFLIKCVCHA